MEVKKNCVSTIHFYLGFHEYQICSYSTTGPNMCDVFLHSCSTNSASQFELVFNFVLCLYCDAHI